jgi:DNA end-binding protein Ku
LPRERSRTQRFRRNGGDAEPARGRALWSGVISFGLVAVPVELFAGNRHSTLSLRMLTPDGTPLARRYVCPEDGRMLSGDDIERGYEVSEGKFVTVTDEELEQLSPKRSREIALERFVPRDQIDPAWFVRSYFLVPGEDQQRAYRLLAETMEQAERAGIAKFVMRGREYAVAIFAEKGILRAETLRFGDELRRPADLGLPQPGDVSSARVRKMARQVDALAKKDLDPAELDDDRIERLRELAERKREHDEDVVRAPEAAGAGDADEAEGGEVVDLMALLKERIGAKGSAGARSTRKRPAAKKASRAKRPRRSSARRPAARSRA